MPIFSYSMNPHRFHRAETMRLSGAENDVLDGDAFWRFSLALYARPGVADALIAIQDRAGRDVNVILFGLWLGVSRGRLLAAAELAVTEAAIAPIKDVAVAPLRRLRRQLKQSDDPDLQALRRRVAALEIVAERRVQYRLAASLSGELRAAAEGDQLAVAQANLALILGDTARSPEAGALFQALAALTRRVG
jgi:uncharacterized protein (TIGR02444 family)